MLLESEERAADLAVSRYGADPARVQALVHTVREARARGDPLDLLDLLEQASVLSPDQLGDLRFGLAQTQIDGQGPNGNGAPAPPPEPSDDALTELRALGEYRVLRRLGEGGMGAVFLAFHEQDQQQVAIKVLSSQLARNQPTLDRFYREAKSGALLNHPNIVRNHAAGQDRTTGLHYLVLEFVDGASAQQLLERFGRLPVGDALHIVLDIARGLEHAHSRNIVHRDIKPGNILITKSGLAKLSDLGLAKRTDEAGHVSSRTSAGQGFGTPYYMPYEQAMNARRADARSDIYALGATLYHLVAGEVPFPGANPLEIVDKKGIGDYLPASVHNPASPPELDSILARMMARDPQDRYQTASELIVDLERSGLAAAMPSFIDQAEAFSDPLVRERLTAPAQATVLDVRGNGTAKVFWYVLYRDARGRLGKAKMTTALVRKRLESGKLTARAKAARAPKGPYAPLYSIDEFDDLAPPPVLRAPRKKPALASMGGESQAETLERRWWLLSVGLVVAVLGILSWALVMWSG